MAAYLAVLDAEAEAERGFRRERVYYDRTNPFEVPEWEFLRHYRLPKHTVMSICDELRPDLEVETQRGRPVPVETQVLICLHFLATGSIQWVSGNDHRHLVSQPTVSRCISRVTKSIVSRLRRHISFPSTRETQREIKIGFAAVCGFSGVVGAIDCTHVPIKKPNSPDAHSFLNRKGSYSINVQFVCDASAKILDVVAKWPGGTHDASIWNNSNLKAKFSSGELPGGSWLIGDSGYPQELSLMTPIRKPRDAAEEYYNVCHRRTRNTIERCNGLWKGRWRSMAHFGGILLYEPPKICEMIVATCILHNICVGLRLPDPEDLVIPDIEDDVIYDDQEPGQTAARARNLRLELVDSLYSRR